MKRLIGVFLALSMLMAMGQTAYAIQDTDLNAMETGKASGFSDVPDDAWYVKSLNKNVEMGLLSGYTDGTFHPERAVKWWALAQVLYNFTQGYELDWWKDMDAEDPSTKDPWYHPVMNFAQDNELIPKFSDDYDPEGFPEGSPTRFQVIQGFYRLGLRTGAVESTYTKALDWALGEGILKGDEKGNLNLDKNITRAEFSEVLQRVWPVFEGKRIISRLFFLEEQDVEYITVTDGQNGNKITYTDRDTIGEIVEHLNAFRASTMDDGRGGGFNASITLVMNHPGVKKTAILGTGYVSNGRILYGSDDGKSLSKEWIDRICKR